MDDKEFIDSFIDWGKISCHEYLSESFIEKYADKVNWYHISLYQEELSEKYLQLSMTAAEESNKYTSATLKRLLQCLTIYPFKHKEYANLGPQAMATFDKMATAKDMYVDLGMFIIQVNKLDSALKAERSEDKEETK